MATTHSELYDAIVIGAGIQGCFTSYHFAKNKRKVLLLEQFFLPHSRGSSHGQSRIIRRAYSEDFYTKMMDECYQIWAQLENESGTKLYRPGVQGQCSHPLYHHRTTTQLPLVSKVPDKPSNGNDSAPKMARIITSSMRKF